jgi:hypothetical protein
MSRYVTSQKLPETNRKANAGALTMVGGGKASSTITAMKAICKSTTRRMTPMERKIEINGDLKREKKPKGSGRVRVGYIPKRSWQKRKIAKAMGVGRTIRKIFV